MTTRFLTFDDATHTYWLAGEPLPSVTQILAAMGCTDYAGVDPAVLAAAAAFGRAGHLATHYDDLGDLDETTLDPALVPIVDAWRMFRRDFDVDPLEFYCERPLAHARYRYAGTPDCVGTVRGELAVIDRKIVATVQPATALQTVAYRLLMADTDKSQPWASARRFAVNLGRDGHYTVHEYRDTGDADTWRAVLRAYHWRARHGLVAPARSAAPTNGTAAGDAAEDGTP